LGLPVWSRPAVPSSSAVAMDLRTIMNSDASGGANNASPPLQRSPIQQPGPETLYNHQQNEASPSGPSYQAAYLGRPPQPPPLQPPHRSPDGSSSYASAQSPYRYNSVSSLGGGTHSQHDQSPAQSSPSYPSVSRDAYIANAANSAVYNQQPPGPLASPYTPQSISAGQQPQQQQSYFSNQRSQSIQSVLSPSSPYSYSYLSRESPHPAGSQQGLQQPQQFSPHAQRSQPGTPLGPPSTSYQRASPQTARPQSSGRDSQRTRMSSPWGAQETHVREQRSVTSPIAQTGPSRQDSRSSGQAPMPYSAEMDRERSVSVSPKTIVSSTPRQASVAGSQERTSPPNRNSLEEGRRKESPTGTAFNPSHGGAGATSSTYQSATPQPSYTPSAAAGPHTNNSPSSGALSSSQPQKSDNTASSGAGSSSQPQKRKRMRYDEPPIYARKATRTSGRSPVIPNPRPPVPKHARHLLDEWSSSQQQQDQQQPQQQQQRPIPRPATAAAPSTRNQANGIVPANGRPVPAAPPGPSHGPLGPWEPSITGLIPHEEITKLVCDFLFQQVVVRKDLGAGPAGAAATGQGAILEVEAKLGQLVDKNRGERLRLPVMTECVISRDDPSLRISFESSMTLVSALKPISRVS